ncbi:hypothetical protein [Bradyrhizobium yuanmingense]|uniref:hypothetical protein n=1 Tax=Bradyrhizobium yuanmingense TaxID=108015 RepID=UPI003512D08F
MSSTSPTSAACQPARGVGRWRQARGRDAAKPASIRTEQDNEPADPNKVGIRIDLTGIGVSKPKNQRRLVSLRH